jgi:hypothetical protein
MASPSGCAYSPNGRAAIRQRGSDFLQFLEPLFEEAPGRLLCGQLDGAFVGLARLGAAAEAAAEVRARGMRELVLVEIAVRQQAVELRETGFGPIAHGHRDAAIEFDDR